jgi:membrane protein implicated in regulation of membrane protease activity
VLIIARSFRADWVLLTVFWRYWLLQIPGWGVLAAALWAADRYAGLPLSWAAAIFFVWLLKDWAIYPILKDHYRFRAEPPSNRIVGQIARAREPLRSTGYVELKGELWLAELVSDGASVDSVKEGEEVTVESVEGLTLRVRRKP